MKIAFFAVLVALLFSIFTSEAYASEPIKYGLNHYDKLYMNEIGMMALSKGDVLKIDGEYNNHYYTITKSGNVFFVPKNRVELIDPMNPAFTQEYINSRIERQSKITEVVGFAYMQLGKPYFWGGKGTVAYDCSSLMQTSYRTVGTEIPRTSRVQSEFGQIVAPHSLQIGDLVFFKGSGGYVSHVGMYIGEGQFIHASSSQAKVTISGLSESYYQNHIVGARRIID